MNTLPPDVGQLVADIRSNTNRQNAYETLICLKSAASTRALLDLMTDYRVPPYYANIIHELGQRGAIDSMQHFCQILLADSDDGNIRDQMTALILLAYYPQHSATVALIEHVLRHHDHPYMLGYGVYVLGQIGNDEAVYALSLLMSQHPNDKVRHDVVNVLGSTCNPHAVTALLNYLEREHAPSGRGGVPARCVNAMNGLLRLWEAKTQPFDVQRWLDALTYWLYRDTSPYPNALYTLNKLDMAQAETIIADWQDWRGTAGKRLSDTDFFR